MEFQMIQRAKGQITNENSLIRKKKVWQGHEKSFLPSIKRRPSLPIMQSFAILILKVTKIEFLPTLETSLAAVILAIFSDKGQERPRKCRKALLHLSLGHPF